MVVAQSYQLLRIDEILASTGASGRYVTFSYATGTGRLTGVQSSDGRTVTYAHDTLGTGTRGNLTQVTGLEGIVSKRASSRYQSGRTPHWLKFKNPNAPAVKREAEEDWGK